MPDNRRPKPETYRVFAGCRQRRGIPVFGLGDAIRTSHRYAGEEVRVRQDNYVPCSQCGPNDWKQSEYWCNRCQGTSYVLEPWPKTPAEDAKLAELLEGARGHTLTAEEVFEQKVSWVYGEMGMAGSTVTKDEVRERLRSSR